MADGGLTQLPASSEEKSDVNIRPASSTKVGDT